MRHARHVENEDTWQRSVDVETHRHQDTGTGNLKCRISSVQNVCKHNYR